MSLPLGFARQHTSHQRAYSPSPLLLALLVMHLDMTHPPTQPDDFRDCLHLQKKRPPAPLPTSLASSHLIRQCVQQLLHPKSSCGALQAKAPRTHSRVCLHRPQPRPAKRATETRPRSVLHPHCWPCMAWHGIAQGRLLCRSESSFRAVTSGGCALQYCTILPCTPDYPWEDSAVGALHDTSPTVI